MAARSPSNRARKLDSQRSDDRGGRCPSAVFIDGSRAKSRCDRVSQHRLRLRRFARRQFRAGTPLWRVGGSGGRETLRVPFARAWTTGKGSLSIDALARDQQQRPSAGPPGSGTRMGLTSWTVGLLRRAAQRFGPYLLIEMLLPGGTLLALLLLVYRRWKRRSGYSRPADRASAADASTARVAPAGSSTFEAAMTAFADCAGVASSSRSASSRKIGVNRCPA